MPYQLRQSFTAGKGRAFMARELQVLAVGCVFVFLGAIVVGIF
jgi:hypothetical protein